MAKDLRVAMYDAIYEWSMIDTMPDGDAKTKQVKRTRNLANSLGDAIQDYLVKNTWTITNMVANVQVDHIKTTGKIPIDVDPNLLKKPLIPLFNGLAAHPNVGLKVGEACGKLYDTLSTNKNPLKTRPQGGAQSHKLKLHKYGTFLQGGRLDAKGQAFIGPKDTTNYAPGAILKTEFQNMSTVQLDPAKLKLNGKV